MSLAKMQEVRQGLLTRASEIDGYLAAALGEEQSSVAASPLESTLVAQPKTTAADIDYLLADALGEETFSEEPKLIETAPVAEPFSIEDEYIAARMELERRKALGRLGGIMMRQYDIARLIDVGVNDQIEIPDNSVTAAKLITATQLGQELDFVPAPNIFEKRTFGKNHDNYMYPIGLRRFRDRDIAFFYKTAKEYLQGENARKIDDVADISPFVVRNGVGVDREPAYFVRWHTIIAVGADAIGGEAMVEPKDDHFVVTIKQVLPKLIKRYQDYTARLSRAA